MKLFHLIVYLFTLPLVARSWDLAVATEATLELFTSKGDKLNSILENFTDLTAITYDPEKKCIFFADSKHGNSSIYRLDIETKEIMPLKMPKLQHKVRGITYDPKNDTLYWTNGAGRTISKIKADGSEEQPTTLLQFNQGQILSGITIDKCRDVLYWVNSNHNNPSIERASLDGSGHKVIVRDDLFQPLDVAVDYDHLYWSDDSQGIYYVIERTDLDGGERVRLVHDTYHDPIALSVDQNDVFWFDYASKTVYTVPKTAPETGKTHKERRVMNFSKIKPIGLVTSFLPNCHPEPEAATEEASTYQNDEQPAVTREFPDGCEDKHDYCLNGVYERRTRKCVCHPGFSGLQCESQPCMDFCKNGGKCYMTVTGDDLKCECGRGFGGKRCETSGDAGYNSSQSAMVDSANHMCVNGEIDQIIVAVLGTVIVVMMIVITYLVRKVCLLRKRPRIKKHIIVNKSVRPTPLTSRPTQGEQCEITIENCCNMNICETPCFEPQLRTSKSQSKTEEKKNLLGSMEETSSCPPTQDDLY